MDISQFTSAQLEWGVVGFLGAVVGVVELVSRYRDAPMQALLSRHRIPWPYRKDGHLAWRYLSVRLPVPDKGATVYVLLNVTAALITYALIHAFDWEFGIDGAANEEAQRWVRVIAAGLGAMAILRLTFFTVQSGDRSVNIGLSALLEVLLEATDRAVDRRRAGERNAVVSQVMQGVSFWLAYTALPAYCLNLLQNVGSQESFRLSNQIALLKEQEGITEELKSWLLGLLILNVVGEQVLRQAVISLGDEIKRSPSASPGAGLLTPQEVQTIISAEAEPAQEGADSPASTTPVEPLPNGAGQSPPSAPNPSTPSS